jgi:predicted RNase H-like HicB family nuclease
VVLVKQLGSWSSEASVSSVRPTSTGLVRRLLPADELQLRASHAAVRTAATYTALSDEGNEASMQFTIEVEREDDGRWLAEVVQLPGALAYGSSADEAMAKAEALALRALAERLEHGEAGPANISIVVPAVA